MHIGKLSDEFPTTSGGGRNFDLYRNLANNSKFVER